MRPRYRSAHGVSIRTTRRWIANEVLVSAKVGGARLIAKRELERLLSPNSDFDDEGQNQEIK
jgi:hypothetical protein